MGDGLVRFDFERLDVFRVAVMVCRRLGLTEAPRVDGALDVLQRVIGMLMTLVRRCGARAQARIDGPNAA